MTMATFFFDFFENHNYLNLLPLEQELLMCSSHIPVQVPDMNKIQNRLKSQRN